MTGKSTFFPRRRERTRWSEGLASSTRKNGGWKKRKCRLTKKKKGKNKNKSENKEKRKRQRKQKQKREEEEKRPKKEDQVQGKQELGQHNKKWENKNGIEQEEQH